MTQTIYCPFTNPEQCVTEYYQADYALDLRCSWFHSCRVALPNPGGKQKKGPDFFRPLFYCFGQLLFREVFFGFFIEGYFAAFGAEVIGLSFVFGGSCSGAFLHFHLAYRVDCFCHFSFPPTRSFFKSVPPPQRYLTLQNHGFDPVG